MTEITARSIFETPKQNIWNIPDVIYNVQYEDGVTTPSTLKRIIFNRFCWELFNHYPHTPITSVCDINFIIGKKYYNADTHIKLLESIFKHIVGYNNIRLYQHKEPMLRSVFEIVNDIYNGIVHRISDYVSTIDATDFVNLVRSKEVSEIHNNLTASPESIDRSYRQISDYMNNPVNNNRFVRAYRAKSINENQANQCIGPRGFVTDLDRSVFKQPILNGFIKGMGNLYEIITESRTAAKSLNANDTQIKTSEYASRRIQILTMSVTGIDPVDCGSTDYMDFYLAKEYLECLKGIYYLNEETNTLTDIKGNETELIGKVIKIRTALGCHSPDPAKICTTCLGKIAENFKENSNLGYVMTAYLMEKLTQTILSTKHLTHSVKKSLIHLEGAVNKYFRSDEENHIYFNSDVDLHPVYLVLPNAKLSKLVDVMNLPHTNIALSKIGELETIGVRTMTSKGPIQELINISYRDRLSIITRPFLNHIKNSHIDSDARGNFVIPMADFDKSQPVFSNPLKETNIISFVNKIAAMIETTKEKQSDPYEKLLTLFTAVNEQFKCNLSVVQVLVYAVTTRNAYDGNYQLGRFSEHPRCEGNTVLFRHRSLSQLLSFEEQSKELLNNAPYLFSGKARTSHPMDILFNP